METPLVCQTDYKAGSPQVATHYGWFSEKPSGHD